MQRYFSPVTFLFVRTSFLSISRAVTFASSSCLCCGFSLLTFVPLSISQQHKDYTAAREQAELKSRLAVLQEQILALVDEAEAKAIAARLAQEKADEQRLALENALQTEVGRSHAALAAKTAEVMKAEAMAVRLAEEALQHATQRDEWSVRESKARLDAAELAASLKQATEAADAAKSELAQGVALLDTLEASLTVAQAEIASVKAQAAATEAELRAEIQTGVDLLNSLEEETTKEIEEKTKIEANSIAVT
jgi:hypothetical protein